MMDNYEEARRDTGPLNDNNILHSMELKDRVEFIAFNGVEHSPHGDYDFGAEILKTTNHQTTMSATAAAAAESRDEAEELIKTKQEKCTTTQCVAEEFSLGDDDEQATALTKDSGAQDTPVTAEDTGEDNTEMPSEYSANYPTDTEDQSERQSPDQTHTPADGDTVEERPPSADDDSEESTSDSDFSDLSGMSDVSGRDWKPISSRPINWVQRQMHSGADPRELLSQMLPSGTANIEAGVNDMMLWRLLASMLTEPPRRQKLRYINTFDDVVNLVLEAKNIIVLTGAGVSVSCGIPDFRSSDGIYSRLAKDFPDLPDPQAMFDINYFSRDPRPFYKFAREIYPGQFRPSPCHRFIKLLEQKHKLLRNYTQNIDTLEQVAGIENVIECHGSFSTASCTKCKYKCDADAIRAAIFAQCIPVCHRCQPNVQQSVDASERVSEEELKRLVENGIMKPDIVFFGEGLPEEFHTVMASDKDKCDLLIVMGSSLKVRPVALIPSSIPAHVPQILINREQLHHLDFDVELLGDSDVIINQLCHRLGDSWKEICYSDEILQESRELLPAAAATYAGDSTSEEDGHDTQSVKSNASTDIALQSAGTYSDSGFESSTSSGVVKPLEETAVDFQAITFADRLKCGQAERNLSVDSSKDSGIQCDSTGGPGLAEDQQHSTRQDSGGTPADPSLADADACPSSSTAAATTTTTCVSQSAAAKALTSKTQMTTGTAKPRPRSKSQSASERLLAGTYYRHEDTTSYVFPGAQVSWSASCDSDDETENNEDDDEEDEENANDFDDEECGVGDDEDEEDGNAVPLSPLLPPSVEAEMVSELASAVTSSSVACRTGGGSNKRRSTESVYTAIESSTLVAEQAANGCISVETTTAAATAVITSSCSSSLPCSPPPVKKRRDSCEAAEAVAALVDSQTAFTTITTTTTITQHPEESISTEGGLN